MEAVQLTEAEKQELDAEITEALKSTQWRRAIAPKNNKPYYFHRTTKATQWTLPEELQQVEKELKEKILARRATAPAASPPATAQQETADSSLSSSAGGREIAATASGDRASIPTVSENGKPKTTSGAQGYAASSVASPTGPSSVESERSEEEQRQLEEFLSRKDSILEQGTISNAKKLIRVYKHSPQTIIEKLVSSYSGYPQMCRALVEVLLFAQTMVDKRPGDLAATSQPSSSSAEGESIVVNHLAGIIQQHFTKKLADEILLKYNHPPEWIKTMIHHDALRSTLSNLSQRHRDSTFLRYCTKEMNVLGYGSKHSPAAIAASMDSLARAYGLLLEVLVKSFSGQETDMLVEELVLLVRSDAELIALIRYECIQIKRVLVDRDPTLGEDETQEPSSKRSRREEDGTAFLYSDRLKLVQASLHRLEDSLRSIASKVIGRRPVDVNLMKRKLQDDSLLEALVTVMENEECSSTSLTRLQQAIGSVESANGAWSQIRFVWSSPALLSILLDLFLAGQAEVLPVLARAAMIASILPKMVDCLCDLTTVPSTRKECQEALESVYDFRNWKTSFVEDVEQEVPKVQALFREITGMLYGAVEKDKVAELVQLIRSRRINANCFLRLLIRTYSKGPQSDTEQSVNTGVIVSQWASALLEVVVAHPIFAADIVHAVELMLESLPTGVDGDDMALESARALNNAAAKKDLLGVLVDIVHSGFAVEAVCQYIQSNADKFDAVSIRFVMHSLLVGLRSSIWHAHVAALVDLVCQPVLMRAVSNVHFRKEGVDNLRKLIMDTGTLQLSEATQSRLQELKALLAELN